MVLLIAFLAGCNQSGDSRMDSNRQFHADVPFLQDYSIKFYSTSEGVNLTRVAFDRNGLVSLVSDAGLLHPHNGRFLYPGTLEADNRNRPMRDKKIRDVLSYDEQLVYLDNKAVFSNAWAGSIYWMHGLEDAKIFAAGNEFSFLVANGKQLVLVAADGIRWQGDASLDKVVFVRHNATDNRFYLLGENALVAINATSGAEELRFNQPGLTAFDFTPNGGQAIVGTGNGYLTVDLKTGELVGAPAQRLPVTEITAVELVYGKLWFGSTLGAFMLREDGKFNYYNGERWLPGDRVQSISAGPEGSVLILTDKGMAQICFEEMTLADKADYFGQQVRARHIRYGFNATLEGLVNGNLSTGFLKDSDNDGLWTSMYLAAEVYRYSLTGAADALQNTIESLDAMERLYTINPVYGFPSRSYERSGYIQVLSDPHRWQHASDPEWDWKSTTSSDEAIGHVFVLGAIAELVDVEPVRKKAIHLLDKLMDHVVDNDFYLIDFDGKPTLWGKWHPDYVNGFPTSVGDRKLNSSNIVAMLQTAYHFTGKEKFKDAAYYLMEEHGYLENLMRPMAKIGIADDAGDWAAMLSESWNHSDDEMYFLGYWGLYRYAFTDELKAQFREAIVDHWEAERPEKEGLWNIMTALVEVQEFDLDEAIWYLQEHPLDLITWSIQNSHRKDVEFIPDNFRRQTLTEVLPPDERPIQRHNANMFRLDRIGSNGTSEYSAGDIWLLPYWMGRYLGVIGAPEKP